MSDRPTNAVRTVAAVVADAAKAWPADVGLRVSGAELTFREIETLSLRWLEALRGLGLRRGDTLLILLPNCHEYVLAWLGAASGGVVEVPVNTEYRGETLRHVLTDSRARVIVTAHEFLERVEAVRPPHLETVALIDGLPADLKRGAGVVDLVLPDQTAVPDLTVLEKDPIAVMYTSGTTGISKGALISHRHAYEYAGAVRHILNVGSDDVYYAGLPLFHVAGQWAVVYACIQAGATAVLAPRFSASQYWPECEKARATVTFLLGAMAQFLTSQDETPHDAENPVKRALIAPLVNDVSQFKKRFGMDVTTCYGSTESGVPLIGDFDVEHPAAVGRARDGYDLRIVDEHDEELPAGEVGELVVRPAETWRTFLEYLGLPEATRDAQRNLWFHTGDAMRVDHDGNYFFVDRLKDAIRRRGENISSFEVEREVLAHSAVAECAAVGVRSEATEDDLVVFVVARPGQELNEGDLTSFLRVNAPKFMVPDRVVVVDSLPMTPTGKVQKVALRAQLQNDSSGEH